MSDLTVTLNTATGDRSLIDPRLAGGEVRDYLALLKPRVMFLVVFSGIAGMVLAPGDLHPVLAFTAILCIAVGSGASGAINMWYDRDIDAVMSRTASRPIPSGRLQAGDALGFGVTLAVASVIVMGLAVNHVAAALLALAIGFYVFIYTVWLKRRTTQNIVIGGAAGAFPPMIGWAAVTGDVSLAPVVLFLIIFMWTPPHFWALALYKSGEYGDAGVPMLPVVAGQRATKWQMMVYSVLLLPLSVVPYWQGVTGWRYAVAAVVLSGLLLLCNVRVLRSEEDKPAKQMFTYSILYLFLLFTVMMVDGTAHRWVG